MSANTQQRIQQAAIRLILHYGYDKTSMEDIAQEAGVARSTIYTRWKTKEALFASLLQAEAVKLAKTWLALVEADPDGGGFTGIYRNGLLAIRENAFARALYTQDRRVLGGFASQPQIAQLMADRLSWQIRLLEKLQDARLIRAEIDVRAAALTAIIFRQGLLTLDPNIAEQSGVDEARVLDQFVAMFRRYVEAEGTPERSDLGKQIFRDFLEEFTHEYPLAAPRG